MFTTNSRLEFHKELESIEGIKKAYFQPPASVKMVYPCIRYTRSSGNNIYANNYSYKFKQSYDVTVIDPDPDSKIPYEILKKFNMCRLDRTYISNNLNHTVFKIYY